MNLLTRKGKRMGDDFDGVEKLDSSDVGMIEPAVKRLAERVARKREDLINEAITFIVGEGWESAEVKPRGRLLIYPDGKEVFEFDGKPTLEFYGVTHDLLIDRFQQKAKVALHYKKLF